MLPAFTRARPDKAGARPVVLPANPFHAPSFAVVALLMAVYAIGFGWLSLERYWAFQMHALDMGNMGQAAWNTVHGHPFRFTNIRLVGYQIEAWGTTTRLSFHVEALLPFISLVYLVYPHPESLLVLQTMALSLGALPCYLLARRVLANNWFGVLFAALYLLHPTVEGMNLYEFHPVALATPLLLFAFWFLYSHRPLPCAVFALAAIGTKEELGLVVALLGLYGAFFLGQRRLGLSLAALGTIWSLFATVVVEHHFRHPGTVTYLHTRYTWLFGLHGGASHHALHVLRHDPGAILRVLFVWPKLAYLERLLAPAGYLSLLSPVLFLIAAPTLALNLFSNDFHMFTGMGQDSAEIVSAVMIASIFGTRSLIRVIQPRVGTRRALLAVGIFLSIQGLLYQHSDGFTPLGARFQVPVVDAHAAVEQRFVNMIPAGTPVSTQDQLDPALSSRSGLYLFEDQGGRTQSGVPDAHYVLLDVSGQTYPLPSYQLYDRAMSLLQHGWHMQAADDGLILLRVGRGAVRPPASFYRFAETGNNLPSHTVSGNPGAMQLVGFDRAELDRPNHPIPNFQYTLYLRTMARSVRRIEPVVFETLGGHVTACSADALGLSWLPSNRWTVGTTYRFHMSTIETQPGQPGVARFYAELVPAMPHDPRFRNCGTLWSRHGLLTDLGSLTVRF